MDTHKLNNELIGLSKNDYFDRILGNEKDFFFLVIHADSEDTGRVATRVGKHLKKIADEHGFQSWNTYTINRTLFENIKKIIGRVKNVNVYEDTENPYPIEIYIKTPHSRDYLFIPYRSNKFFEDRTEKKISQKMKKVRHLLESVSDEEDLREKLAYSFNKVNSPMVVMRIDDYDKEQQKKVTKKYAKMAFMCLERKFLPYDSKFILVKNSKLADQLGLERNCPYVLKNDVIQAYERYSGKIIEGNRDCVKFDMYDFGNTKALLKKYDNSQLRIFNTEKNSDAEGEKKARKMKEVKAFVNFILPRVVVLRDAKQRHLGQLLRKCIDDKSKYVLSLYCPSTDPNRDAKLAVFMDLYRRYKDRIIFCIIESDVLQDLFTHSKATLPSFVLFNFLNQKKDFGALGQYYKSVIYPYEKYILNPGSIHPNEQEIMDSIDIILSGEGRTDSLNLISENVQEIKGVSVEDVMERLRRTGQDGLIEFYDKGIKSTECSQIVDRLSEDFQNKVKFFRMDDVNTNEMLPVFSEFPKLVYVSSKHRKMYVLDNAYTQDGERLRRFIREIHNS